MTDDVLGRGIDAVDEIEKLSSVGMSGKSVDGDHLTTDLHDLRFAVDEHGHLSEALLKTAPQGALGLVPDEAERIALFVGPVLEVLHHRAAVQHARGRKNDARRRIHDDALSQFSAFHRSEPLAGERVLAVVLQQIGRAHV